MVRCNNTIFPICTMNCTFTVSRGVSSAEFGDLETLCKAVVKEKQPFERLEISKETLLKMFKVREEALPSAVRLRPSHCVE